jgi:tyrosyl-tRNA synthetase
MTIDIREELAIFKRGVVDLIEPKELETLLEKSRATKKPLRIKFGMDPSSADLHVGHAIPLLKLRALQELGHKVVLIVGDATAMVGDPSGRNKLRPQLTRPEVEANLLTYVEQAGKVLDVSKTEIRRNSEWFDKMSFQDVLKLAGRMTVARMIERDTFQKRITENEPIGIHELLYPLMQGWDSVMIRCDMELGGTDQLFNLLRGRDLQREEGQPGQVCFTTPLINGLDGRKMSKSYGNTVGLTDGPHEMFVKIMKIDDGAMGDWFTMLTRVPTSEIDALLAGDRRAAKVRLAEEIATFFHGADAARAAHERFDREYRDRELPEVIAEFAWPEHAYGKALPLPNLLRDVKLVSTTSEARRMIEQGGVRVQGNVVRDLAHAVAEGDLPVLLQVGKHKFARVRGGSV